MTAVEQPSPEAENLSENDKVMQEGFGEAEADMPEPVEPTHETSESNESITETVDALWQELFGATPEEMKERVAVIGGNLGQNSRRYTETIPREIDNLIVRFGYDRPGAIQAAQALAQRIDDLKTQTDHGLRAVVGIFKLSHPEKLDEYYRVAQHAQAQLDERPEPSEEDGRLRMRLEALQEAIKLAHSLIVQPGNAQADLRELGNWYAIQHRMMSDPHYDPADLRLRRPGVPQSVARTLQVLDKIHRA